MPITRRALLLGAVGVGLVACRPHHRSPVVTADPDAAAKATAIDTERVIIAHFDETMLTLAPARRAPVERLRAEHVEHLRAIQGHQPSPGTGSATASRSGSPGSAPPAPVTSNEAFGAGATAFAAAHDSIAASVSPLQAAAVAAHRGRTAAVLASVAAAHARADGRASTRLLLRVIR